MKMLLGTLILSLAAVSTANAGFGRGGPPVWDPPKTPAAAPEIDPMSAGSALTLLAGGLAVIRSRRFKRK